MRTFEELNAMRLRRSDPGWSEWIWERELARMRENPQLLEEYWQGTLRYVCDPAVDDWELGVRAAGTLESTLGCYGELLIDRLEAEAACNERLRKALARIWQAGMSDTLWERVKAIQRSVPAPADLQQG